MLCIEFPQAVTQGIIALLDKRDDENCDFEEFLQAIRTIFLYDSFFEEMDSIFRHIDNNKTGKVMLAELTESLDKLHTPEIGSMHELRVPESSDVEKAYKGLEVVTI